jgi:hypothetical protein
MKEEDKHSNNFKKLLEKQDIYECEHQNKITRKIEAGYTIIVCNKCFKEFTNHETRPLSLAKQILSLSNKMIENTPTFMDGKGLDKSLNLWYNCNNDVLEQLYHKFSDLSNPLPSINVGVFSIILLLKDKICFANDSGLVS